MTKKRRYKIDAVQKAKIALEALRPRFEAVRLQTAASRTPDK
jgi:hypothetical protein